MKVAIFGATGGTGRLLVARALEEGCDVTVYTRRASAPQHERLTAVFGPNGDPVAIDRAVAGRDAVLCALGGTPSRRRERVCSTAMAQIVPAMQRHGVRRLLAISTFGAGDTRPAVGFFVRTIVFGAVLRSEVADKEAMEGILAQSGLDWTVVRVGVLTDDAAKGAYRAADDGSIRGMGKISRADVADFMLKELASGAWVRRRPVVQY